MRPTCMMPPRLLDQWKCCAAQAVRFCTGRGGRGVEHATNTAIKKKCQREARRALHPSCVGESKRCHRDERKPSKKQPLLQHRGPAQLAVSY